MLAPLLTLLSACALGLPSFATQSTDPSGLGRQDVGRPIGETHRNLRLAREVLRRSLAAYGSMAGRLSVAELDISFTGTLSYQGHYRRPGEGREFELRNRYRASEYWDAVSSTTRISSRTGKSVNAQVLVAGDQVFETEAGMRVGSQLHGREALAVRSALRAFLPHQLLERIDQNADGLRHLGRVELRERPHALLSYTDLDGRSITILIDAETWLMTRVEYLRHMPGRGDCVDFIEYEEHKVIGGIQIPHRRHSVEFDKEARTEQYLRVAGVSYGRRALRSDFYLPKDRIPGDRPEELAAQWASALQVPGDRAAPSLVVHELGGGLWMMALHEQDCKVVVATFKDYSVVLEAPGDSESGTQIIEAVAKRTPNQPVRYLVLSHHHSHASAGLRPFVEAGVTLVTTPGNVEYFKRLANWSYAIEPDGQEVMREQVDFRIVEGRDTFEDDTQELLLVDIGGLSGQTDEYLVCWLPRQGVLCEGDLALELGLPELGPASKSVRALHAMIRGLKFDVQSIVQARPLVRRALVTSMSELDGLVQTREASSR
ncbi:MAG: glyoxylase-like metal-dependent hydrolase (beta-lactamase superfamily II) [Planctomycetota bacterium]|jgi:glyoxylase-like metal-dependent hydrolase (beta-lactamase superfamily II)